jgi:hypothetical protein
LEAALLYSPCSGLVLISEIITRDFAKGMTWDNRVDWHIDHIMPISSAKTEADVLRLHHFTNLRPLWAHENAAKGDAKVVLL